MHVKAGIIEKESSRLFSILILATMLMWSITMVLPTPEAAKTEVDSDTEHTTLQSGGVPSIEWNMTYGGTGTEWIYDLVETDDGGYALAGFTSSWGAGGADVWLLRSDAYGNALWNKTMGGVGSDYTESLVQTDDGGYALGGLTVYSSNYDFALWRTDKTGKSLFEMTYGDPTIFERADSLVQTLDGGFALAGARTENTSGFCLVKTDPSGNMEWNGTYRPHPLVAAATDLVQTSDGGYAMVGLIGESIGPFDFWLVRTDAAGKMLWNNTYGGAGDDRAWSLVETDDGGYALAGFTRSFGAGGEDFWLVRTDMNGNELWNKTYGETGEEDANSVVQTHDGGFAIAGYDDDSTLLVKTDANGDEQWNLTLGNYGALCSLIQDDGGGYVLAGSTARTGGDGWLLKLAAEDNLYHDVDLVRLVTSKTGCLPKPTAGQNTKVNISMTIRDQGSYPEAFNVTAYINTTVIATVQIGLLSGQSIVINITLDTSGFAVGYYSLSAYVSPVLEEADTSDNIRYQNIVLTILGDVNGDFTVDIFDAIRLAGAYNSIPISPYWNANADINGDNIVDIFDAILLANHYNEHYP